MRQQRPPQQDIDGILLLDKPLGMSSNHALQAVKRLFNAKKAGHTGSLDPLASGLLPICLGEATKFSQFLLNANKRYHVTAQLGVKTNTGDAEGEIIATQVVTGLTQAHILQALSHFTGTILQVPPMFSALKHQGQPLYKLARKGVQIERPGRSVQIYQLTLLAWKGDYVSLDVTCSKGTYIRTLIEDFGSQLGYGAHVTELRRLSAGPFQQPKLFTLETLQAATKVDHATQLDAYLLPIDITVADLPELTLSIDVAYFLNQGQMIQVDALIQPGLFRLYDQYQRFRGVGEVRSDKYLVARRLLRQI